MNGLAIAFWICAFVGVIAALAVVILRDVFRAALSLILCFLVVAAIYVTLSADFLAAVQVLIYVGAIAVLIILVLMLTKEVQQGSLSSRFKIPAFIVAFLLFGTIGYAVIKTPWHISSVAPVTPTTAALGARLFGDGGYLLAIDIAAVLLLAAVIGVIALVREK